MVIIIEKTEYFLEYGNCFDKYKYNTVRIIPIIEIPIGYKINHYKYIFEENKNEMWNMLCKLQEIIKEKENIYCKDMNILIFCEIMWKNIVYYNEKKNIYNNLYFLYFVLYKLNIFKENEKYEKYDGFNFNKKIIKKYENIKKTQ